jgi:hypothetical protein
MLVKYFAVRQKHYYSRKYRADKDVENTIQQKEVRIADDVRTRLCRKLLQFHKTQHPPGPPDNSMTVINFSEVWLEDAACCALSKGQNYAVAPGSIPVKDFLSGVEKAWRDCGGGPTGDGQDPQSPPSARGQSNWCSPYFRLTKITTPWCWVLQTTTKRSSL